MEITLGLDTVTALELTTSMKNSKFPRVRTAEFAQSVTNVHTFTARSSFSLADDSSTESAVHIRNRIM